MRLHEKLQELKSVQIIDSVNDWEKGIELCFQPLLDQNLIQARYIEQTKKQGLNLNFYYILTEGMAMPHSNPIDGGVLETSISLLLIKNGVQFGDHEFNPVYCLLGLAAKDQEAHLSLMMDIAEIFGDNPEIINKLRNCNTVEQILTVLQNK